MEFKGSTAIITCFSLIKTKWTKNGKQIQDNHSIKHHIISIFNIKNKSSGNYTCYGSNINNLPFEATSELLVGGKQ